jgi:DNA-binding CsgD family transcriptional regulator
MLEQLTWAAVPLQAMQGSNLTSREHEILIWVSRGKTNSEVAAILWISANTVRKHLENIYAKLGVSNRAGAVGVLLGEFSRDPASRAW